MMMLNVNKTTPEQTKCTVAWVQALLIRQAIEFISHFLARVHSVSIIIQNQGEGQIS